jgi:outer membrane receptor protein involved in Fe transport
MAAWVAELVLAIALAAGTPPGAGAGESAPSDLAAVPLEGLLDHSLAAASLREERAADAAASVFVLDGEDLRRQGFTSVAEALGSVPGLFAYRDGFYPYAGVRGVGLVGDFTTRILVLVDGHPVNDALGIGASHLGRDLPVVLDAVKRIEVVKGPVGGVYGPTAFLGVVNVVTEDARPRSGEVRATAEAAQGRARSAGGAAVVSAIEGDVEVLLAVQGTSSRGLDWTFPELAAASDRPAPPGGRVVGRERWGSLSAQGRIERRGLRLAFACNDAATELPSAPYGALLLDRRNGLVNRSCFADVAGARALAPGLTAVARIAYDWFEYRDALAYAEPPAGPGLMHDLGVDRWWSGEVRLEWEPSVGRRFLLGARGEAHATDQRSWSDVVGTVAQDPLNGVGVGDIRRAFAGGSAFLLAEQALGRSVALHGHLALTVHEVYGARLTPKLAAVWRPGRATAVKLVVAEGFRPPLASEAFFEDGVSFLPNPGLRPETVRSVEAAVERGLGRHAKVSASLFRNAYGDLVRFATVPAPDLGRPADPANPADWRQVPLNLDRAVIVGGEIALDVRWRDHLRLWGGLSLQREEQGVLEDFPRATANLAASVRLARWVDLSGRGACASRRAKAEGTAAGERGAVPASCLVDAAATVDLSRERGLSLQLGVSNLLDAVAPSPSPGDFAPVSEAPAPARTFRLTLRWRG